MFILFLFPLCLQHFNPGVQDRLLQTIPNATKNWTNFALWAQVTPRSRGGFISNQLRTPFSSISDSHE